MSIAKTRERHTPEETVANLVKLTEPFRTSFECVDFCVSLTSTTYTMIRHLALLALALGVSSLQLGVKPSRCVHWIQDDHLGREEQKSARVLPPSGNFPLASQLDALRAPAGFLEQAW